jgi:MFS family permease
MSRFHRLVRLPREGRSPAVSDRALGLSFSGRFVDEVLSGAWSALMPTFRRHFGLSLVQVGFLDQLLSWVALVIEPPASLLIDVRSRRVLLAFGATCVGLSTLLMGLAPTYAVLLTAFAIYGLGSGPLAHTADVVNVEAYPDDPERAFGRATSLDTVGALLAPALVAVTGWLHLDWRALLAALGLGALGYAWALAATRFPAPAGRDEEHHLLAELWGNVRTVVADRRARVWLGVLLAFDLFETASLLKYVFLVEHVGLSQAQAALYGAAEQVVDLVALAWLDRRLERSGSAGVLPWAAGATLVLFPAWVLAPGLAARVVLGVPLAFAWTMFWPIAKARSLASIPNRAGAVNAVTTLFVLLPLPIAFSVLAERVGLPTAMAATGAVGSVAVLLTSRVAERGDEQ